MNAKKVLYGCAGLVLALVIVFGLAPHQEVTADIGWPPIYPSGSSVGVTPGEENMVRMVSEVVNLVVEEHEGNPPFATGDTPAAWMRAQVEAEFLMRNLGQDTQTFDVWFPLAASIHYEGMLTYQPENILQDFQVFADGQSVAFEKVKAPDVFNPQMESTWARFKLTFPAGTDVIVRVAYTIYPSGWRPFGSFEYILQTGAGWYGTIGQADVKITLPDKVTPENVSMAGRSVVGQPIAPQPAGFLIVDNTISWHFTDLEPTAQDNIVVDVLEPKAYHDLLAAREGVAGNPTSADAQLSLAKAVEGSVMVVKMLGQHGGGADLAAQANEAYRKALDLDPNRAEIYTRYAEWMLRTEGWVSLMRFGVCPEELCSVVSRGLAKFPNDAALVKLDEDIRSMQQGAAQYITPEGLGPTMTAVASSSSATQDALRTARAGIMAQAITSMPAPPTATATLQPTETPTQAPPTAEPTAVTSQIAPTAAEKGDTAGNWYLVGGLVVLFLGFLALLIWILRKK